MLIATNATVGTKRGAYNTTTKVTGAPAVHLSNVPVYIRELGATLRSEGFDVAWTARMTFDAAYDILPGDLITGWNPLGLATAPTLVVDGEVELKAGVMESHKTCLLKILRQ